MKIHEYQAKEVLRKYGVAVLNGKVACTPEEAEAAAKELGGSLCVVKAQIHAGGRGKAGGKAGGVKLAKTPQEAKAIAASLLGKKLVRG
jgi:succinyl-CoA synthetase beta subunit